MRRNLQAGHRRSGGLHLEVFTPDELTDIHMATLDVFERTGVYVGSAEAQELFHGAGCRVEADGIVKIPGHVVEDAIRSTPSRLAMYGRDPKHDIVLEDGRVGFTNFGEGINVIDPYTGELRQTTKKDVGDCSRIIDALPEIDVIERPLGAHDVPEDAGPLHNAEAIFTNCSKPAFIGPLTGHLARHMRKMAAAIVGGAERLREHPYLSYVICPVAPLRLIEDVCDIVIEGARNRVPVTPVSIVMAGGSAPMSLAGAVVTTNVEILGCLTLGQLASKGAPFVFGSSSSSMDLRFASASVGSPECALINSAVACLARYYLLPSWVAGQ